MRLLLVSSATALMFAASCASEGDEEEGVEVTEDSQYGAGAEGTTALTENVGAEATDTTAGNPTPSYGEGVAAEVPSKPVGNSEALGDYPRNTAGGSYTVTATVLNVRSGPGIQHEKVGRLLKGEGVASLEESNQWIRIKDNQWVSGKYLSKQ